MAQTCWGSEMPKIVTAAELFGVTSAQAQHAWLLSRRTVRQRMASLGIAAGQVGEPDAVDADAQPALAYVNNGRWVADCPTAHCGGALALVEGVPFLCGNCLNVETGHRYRPVTWPADRSAIESALEARVLPEQANWRAGELVAALLDENVEHGIRSR